MELGQRLRQARLKAGLSQRQLCGEVITRNMLSQIENGTARPSIATLDYLARQLGKPISFFLEEQAVTSPNQAVMDAARRAWCAGDYQRAAGELADYRAPDETFDAEMGLLLALVNLKLAEQAIREDRLPYAATLLERAARAGERTPYYTGELERRRLLLRSRIQPEAAAELPSDDDALLAKAVLALENEEYRRAEAYLEAAEDRENSRWQFLRGECYFRRKEYAAAAACYHRAEKELPDRTARQLELCYKEMGDYQKAYEYVCRQLGTARGKL